MFWPVVCSLLLGFALALRMRLSKRVKLNVARGGREMGLLERWYSASAEAGAMPAFAYCVEFAASSAATASLGWWKAETENLACYLYSKHAMLGVSIVDDFGEGSTSAPVHNLVRLQSSVDPRITVQVVQRTSDATWQQECARQQAMVFPANVPPFRLILVHPGSLSSSSSTAIEIILVVHHTMLDGVAGGVLLQEIAEKVVADAAQGGLPAVLAPTPCTEPLPPAVDEVVDLRPRLGSALFAVAQDALPVLRKLSPNGWLGPAAHTPAKQRFPVTAYGEVSPVTLSKLKHACKLHGVTMHGAFVAAAAAGCGATMRRLGALHSETSVSVNSAVSLRPAAQPASRLGTYVTTLGQLVNVQRPLDFWTEARRSNKIIHTPGAREAAASLIGLLSYLPGSWLAFFRRRVDAAPNGRTETVDISNLGVLRMPQTPAGCPVACTGAWFLNEKTGEGSVFMVNLMTLQHGDSAAPVCRVTVTSPGPALSQQDTATFLEEFLTQLRVQAQSTA